MKFLRLKPSSSRQLSPIARFFLSRVNAVNHDLLQSSVARLALAKHRAIFVYLTPRFPLFDVSKIYAAVITV